MSAAFWLLMHRHAEAEDTEAVDTEAVASLTPAVSAARTSGLAPEVLPDVMLEVLADVIWRAFPELPLAVRRELAMERGLVMERAFATERG